MSRGYRVAVVGATGVVGTTMLELLRERGSLRAESSRSPRALRRAAADDGLVVRALNDDADLGGFDVALFSAGGGTSRQWAPRFVEAGAVVVDNSSACRRDPEIPLVVSEVNPHALERHHGLIANPNCSTMQMMVALAPIHRGAGIERLVVATYQSVSGTGKKAIEELDAQARASLRGEEIPARRCTGADRVQRDRCRRQLRRGDDHTDEERKMMFETRKILEDESIGVAVTCVRVPFISATRSRSTCRRVSRSPRGGARAAQRPPRRRRRGRADAAACRRAGTRFSSAGSAATNPIRARSACGSSATTCARARRPTRSRSRRCWWSGACSDRRDSVAA